LGEIIFLKNTRTKLLKINNNKKFRESTSRETGREKNPDIWIIMGSKEKFKFCKLFL
jgi:hypothetical protein